ncbi:hypothetical protein [Halorussus sp. MSC15.2]|uniref:hypothetical protein n=1 Tax=Halorussus sp. MSC15.2 TaxID=2283638 RepID=UPI0013D523AD|nr:hypothetical protein [Halorussus sp. MSC15.2]NEU56338.1 hypothetical protein [Halorussus sp. MSC15.2]
MSGDISIRSSRRTVLKSLASVSAAVAGVSGVSVATERTGADDADVFGEVQRTVIDDTVKRVTPYDNLLVGDKDQTLAYLEEADLSTPERKRARNFLHKMWQKYPVRRVETENTIRYELDPKRNDVAVDGSGALSTAAERRQFGEVASAVGDGGRRLRSGDAAVSPEWAPNDHNRMAGLACEQMDVSSYYAGLARDNGGDPDDWGCQCDVSQYLPDGWPDELVSEIQDAVDQVFHSYRHYWNPDFELWWNGTRYYDGQTGDAPKYAKQYLQKARDEMGTSKYSAFVNLGYATHFLSDAGQPLHTGLELKQFNNQWVHYDYESFVHSNWDSGEKFKDAFQRTQYAAPVDDAAEATKTVAKYSNDYLSTLFYAIYDNPDSWKSNSDVLTITRNCYNKTATHMRGFVEEVQNA